MTTPPPLSDWIDREQEQPNKDDRILIFSPCYPKGDEMRYRIVDAQFFKRTKYATHWCKLVDVQTAIPSPYQQLTRELCHVLNIQIDDKVMPEHLQKALSKAREILLAVEQLNDKVTRTGGITP